MLTQGVPLLLRERHSSERDDVLLLIVEVSLGYHIELVKRCRQRLPGLGGRLFAPGRAPADAASSAVRRCSCSTSSVIGACSGTRSMSFGYNSSSSLS